MPNSTSAIFGAVTYWISRSRRWADRISSFPLQPGEQPSATHEAEGGALFDCTVALVSVVDQLALVEESDGRLTAPVMPHELAATAIFVRTGIDRLEEVAAELVAAAEATQVIEDGRPMGGDGTELVLASVINVIDAQNHLRQVWQQLTVCVDCRQRPKGWEAPGRCYQCDGPTERVFVDEFSRAPFGPDDSPASGAH
jgi:hypothetical protein